MKSKLIIILSIIFAVAGTFFACLGIGVISFDKDKGPILYNLIEKVKVGDYVDYDAGNWEETVDIPNRVSAFTFGGYIKDTSRNDGVNCDYHELDNQGWRVFQIEEDKITLIQAGLSMCYYHGYGNNTNDKSVDILSGNDENIRFDDYLNTNFAESIRILSKEDIDIYYNGDSSYQRIEDDLIRVGAPYWLSSKEGTYYMWYVTEGGSVAVDHVGSYGVRILVTLKSDTKTTGQDDNNVWLLVQESKKDE